MSFFVVIWIIALTLLQKKPCSLFEVLSMNGYFSFLFFFSLAISIFLDSLDFFPPPTPLIFPFQSFVFLTLFNVMISSSKDDSKWWYLNSRDQLAQELRDNGVLNGFVEPIRYFAPTYKRKPGVKTVIYIIDIVITFWHISLSQKKKFEIIKKMDFTAPRSFDSRKSTYCWLISSFSTRKFWRRKSRKFNVYHNFDEFDLFISA